MDDNKFNADEFNEILRQRAEEERRKQPQNFQEEVLPGISRQSAEAFKELGSGLGESIAAPMLPVQAAVAKGVEGITGKEVKPEKKLKNLEAPTVSESLEALGVPESMLPPQYESPLGPMKYPPGFSPRELAGAAIETAGLEGALRGIPRLGKAIQASEKVQAELSAIPRIEPAAPNPKAQAVAERYMESRGQELKPVPKVTVNEDRARKIAQAYEDMPHNPDDPKVKRAYNALINETLEQFQHIKDSGLKISAIEPGQPNPYKNSKELMKDLRDNNHMWFFPTEQGFGPEEKAATSNHPLLVPTKEMYNGKPLLANDVFRIVHDYFGHVKPGVGFGPIGEENAWLNHMRMYSPEAQKALTTETRGQNSWVNYGPHGEHNRANPAQTIYGEQKAGLLPDWAMESEGHPPERLVHYSREDRALPSIDPKYMGTGAAGREAERIGRVPRSYYYKESATPESVVMGGARSVHAIEHPGKIIDLQSPEAQPYISIAEKLSSNEEEATNKLEMLLKDAGYEGFENSESPVKGAVALFHSQTPIKSEPLGPKHFTTARARQAAELRSSQPSLKSSLKKMGEELIKPIKGEEGKAGFIEDLTKSLTKKDKTALTEKDKTALTKQEGTFTKKWKAEEEKVKAEKEIGKLNEIVAQEEYDKYLEQLGKEIAPEYSESQSKYIQRMKEKYGVSPEEASKTFIEERAGGMPIEAEEANVEELTNPTRLAKLVKLQQIEKKYGKLIKDLYQVIANERGEVTDADKALLLKLFHGTATEKPISEFKISGEGASKRIRFNSPEVKESPYATPEVLKALRSGGSHPLLVLENDGAAYESLMKKFPELRDNEDWSAIVYRDIVRRIPVSKEGVKKLKVKVKPVEHIAPNKRLSAGKAKKLADLEENELVYGTPEEFEDLFVANDPEGNPIGSLGLTENKHTSSIRIDPYYRGKGVASELYKQAVDKYGTIRSDRLHHQLPGGRGLWEKFAKENPGAVRQARDPNTLKPLDYKVWQKNTDPELRKHEEMLEKEIDMLRDFPSYGHDEINRKVKSTQEFKKLEAAYEANPTPENYKKQSDFYNKTYLEIKASVPNREQTEKEINDLIAKHKKLTKKSKHVMMAEGGEIEELADGTDDLANRDLVFFRGGEV